MSAFTTIRVSRQTALNIALVHVLRKMEDDDALAEYLDDAIRDQLYNCHIVPNGCNNDDELLTGG